MKRLKELAVAAVTVLSVFIFTGCGLLSTSMYYGVQTSYDNPQWAPPYYSGARYYYLPDIECYYDLSTREFIFLNDGQWRYSPNIPSLYAGYDLNSCFAILLNVNVYRPWMHHQYYVSHYPRYYYRDYYDHSNIPYVRGFNENNRSAIYWKENERSRARSWDDRNLKENRQFKYSKEDRQQQKNYIRQSSENNNDLYGKDNSTRSTRNSGNNANARPQNTDTRTNKNTIIDNKTREESAATSRASRSQNTNYYGRSIGNSVKVNKQMRDNSNETRSTRRSSNSTKSTGRR